VTNEHGSEARSAHPSKTAKGGAAEFVLVQRWASPHPAQIFSELPVGSVPR